MTTAIVITVAEARTRILNGLPTGFITIDVLDDVHMSEIISNPFRFMEIVITAPNSVRNSSVFKAISERAFIFYHVEGEGANPV